MTRTRFRLLAGVGLLSSAIYTAGWYAIATGLAERRVIRGAGWILAQDLAGTVMPLVVALVIAALGRQRQQHESGLQLAVRFHEQLDDGTLGPEHVEVVDVPDEVIARARRRDGGFDA